MARGQAAMPFRLDADGLQRYIAVNRSLARRAEDEGNGWLARELEDVAREAAEQLESLLGRGSRLVGGH